MISVTVKVALEGSNNKNITAGDEKLSVKGRERMISVTFESTLECPQPTHARGLILT